MFRPKGLIVAMTLVCFAIMAVNSNCVLADDVLEQKILFQVKKTKRILQQQVLPRLGSVPETGQTLCYDETGTEIPCAGTGQDGEYQKGSPWPNPRFTSNGDGTVTDNLTGLIWLKNANCFGPEPETWADALSDCSGLADPQCGLSDGSSAGDWRLPNRFELESLLDLGQHSSALPSGHPFTEVQPLNYWSATTYAYSTGSAWFVNMYYGRVSFGYKSSYSFYVWPVRAGQ